MSAANHTAGPWTRDRYGHVVGPNGEDVRFRSLTIAASGSEERLAEAEANTNLAAAATDLLVIAQESIAEFAGLSDTEISVGWGVSTVMRVRRTRAAIAKATTGAAA